MNDNMNNNNQNMDIESLNTNNQIPNNNINQNNNMNNYQNNGMDQTITNNQIPNNSINENNNMNNYQNNGMDQTITNNQIPNNTSATPDSKKKKLKPLLFIGLALIFIIFVLSRFGNSNIKVDKNRNIDYDRLIMIYMVGSDLESGQVGAGTLDLNGINYTTMNNNNTKIIAITGGSKKWHNDYIDVNSTSIYELTSNGYKVVKKQELSNMGNSKLLTDFLNYGYSNYAAKKYDLVFWNHGLGVLGYGSDEISNDYLNLSEINSALNNTAFKGDNKLDLVLFRTCLNGTLEVADTLKKYANYFAASEEVTWMYNGDNVLKSLNNARNTDSGKEIGIKYVDGYMNYISFINRKGTYTYNTYSVTDLSKIDKVEDALADFIKDLDLSSNYSQIAKIRSNMYQYGKSDPSFDSIDLYTLVNNLKSYSPTKAQILLNALSEAVIYNKASDTQSKGLSIYFPYNGGKKIKDKIIKDFYNFDGLKEYKKFIKSFNDIGKNNTTITSLSTNAFDYIYNSENKQSDFKIELTTEELNKIDKISCTVYEKYNGNIYIPVYYSKDVHFDDNTLEFNIKDRQLKVIDELKDGKTLAIYKFHEDDKTKLDLDYVTEQQVTLIEDEETDDYILYYTLALLSNEGMQDSNNDLKIDHAKIYLKLDKKTNNISIEKVLIGGKNSNNQDNITIEEYITIVNLEDYKYITFSLLTTDLSNIKDNTNFTTNELLVLQVETSKLKFALEDYTSNKEYYALFKLYDIYNNFSYSKLIELKQ